MLVLLVQASLAKKQINKTRVISSLELLLGLTGSKKG